MRSYGQHCSLAKSLDVVGDRWSLLIVRELLTGQERWGEIRDGLPGIAKNLLAQRLRDLEAAGVLTHAGDRYTLTERGLALKPVVAALAFWGAPQLVDASGDEHFRPRWLELVASVHDELDLAELDDEHAVLRVNGEELRGTPREVIDELAGVVASRST